VQFNLAGSFALVISLVAVAAPGQENESVAIGELLAPVPLPKQVIAKEGFVKVAGARLWYWDTGGDGPPIVLLHPATGSGLVWGYQQPEFANAGYRVIGYSRKNYVHSEVTEPDEIESEVEDLHRLVQSLKLEKFHAVGLAAGGGIVMQYSVVHPENLLSMTIACSLGNVEDEEYRIASAALRPPSFYRLPPEVRELGPCYRAANPEGMRRWVELEKKSRPYKRLLSVPRSPKQVTWANLKAAKIPTLLLAGDADLYTPPPMLKYFHDRMPGSEMGVIDGAGHSAYWEQPKAFNSKVMEFIGRYSDSSSN